ncbi:hypothetical protein DFS34DRAFT_649265 [Phlyctochytrium arcticum]|nr:hypothetical protein DFS34DRAFT_649265 [Phlyctochytrium arcticum]
MDPAALSNLLTTVITVTGISPTSLREVARSHATASPVTYLQATIGCGLHLTHLLGLTPYRALLFHPRLVSAPYWQVWRGVTSFAVTGMGVLEVGQRALGLLFWQAPLERWFRGVKAGGEPEPYVATSGRSLASSSSPPPPQDLIKSSSSSLQTVIQRIVRPLPPFLTAQLLAAVTLLSLEFIAPAIPSRPSSNLIFPYPMYPAMEYALRWIWALTTVSAPVSLFGVVQLQPVYMPMALCVVGGLTTWKLMVKGLIAALVVCGTMDLRRDDGQTAVSYFSSKVHAWWSWLANVAAGAGPSIGAPGGVRR